MSCWPPQSVDFKQVSVLLRGAKVWADSVKISYCRAQIEEVQQRAAPRCVRVYRTVSTDILCVLAQTPSLEPNAEDGGSGGQDEVECANGTGKPGASC